MQPQINTKKQTRTLNGSLRPTTRMEFEIETQGRLVVPTLVISRTNAEENEDPLRIEFEGVGIQALDCKLDSLQLVELFPDDVPSDDSREVYLKVICTAAMVTSLVKMTFTLGNAEGQTYMQEITINLQNSTHVLCERFTSSDHSGEWVKYFQGHSF